MFKKLMITIDKKVIFNYKGVKKDQGGLLKCYWNAFSDEMNAFKPYGK